MQRLARRHTRYFINEFKKRARPFCSISNSSLFDHSLTGDPNSVVLVEGNGCSRTVVLNRPSFLNALNTSMCNRLQNLYKSWEDNPDIGFVVMKGNGRGFCAGGDIVALHDMIKRGNLEECKEFFWTIYNFIYLVGTYLKPHVAFLDGITMGGGAGVSIPGTFRVATDKTAFATPETLIGFHPDAGASFHLSHLPGHLGEYLGLTGDRLNGVEMIACGLATHYSLSAQLPQVEEYLKNLRTDDPSVIES
ncbi:3-hydroxyisobutyryl-CoA hydrolase-like protein 1, mitochondrial isoform X2, partial [Tanacetum coccineum]